MLIFEDQESVRNLPIDRLKKKNPELFEGGHALSDLQVRIFDLIKDVEVLRGCLVKRQHRTLIVALVPE